MPHKYLLLASAIAAIILLVAWRYASSPEEEAIFKAYPVTETFGGKNAPLVLSTAKDRMYKTRLREAAGAEPNFAGHYILTYWGCGTECIAGAAIDANTGRVFRIPHSTCCWEEGDTPITAYLDSRLAAFEGILNESSEYGTHYYLMTKNGFQYVKSDTREFSCETKTGATGGATESLAIRLSAGAPVRVDYARKRDGNSLCDLMVAKSNKNSIWRVADNRIEVEEYEKKEAYVTYSTDRYTLEVPDDMRDYLCFSPEKTVKSITLIKGKPVCEIRY